MPKRNRQKNDPPSPPADASEYILVRTKERVFWRRKRGTIKNVTLNSGFKKNAEITAIVSPAAKRIYAKLDPFFKGLDTGRFIANVSARLRKALKLNGEMDFSFLLDYEIQPWYPLKKLLDDGYQTTIENNEFIIRIPIRNTVKRHNKQVSDYYFDAILLWGQPGKSKGLRVESDTSPLYEFGQKTTTECKLTINLPAKKMPWMVLLKLSCHEGNKPANMARNYGMKVVGWGGPES